MSRVCHFFPSTPIASMGLVYLPTFSWLIFMVFHVGKYTIVPWILWEGEKGLVSRFLWFPCWDEVILLVTQLRG